MNFLIQFLFSIFSKIKLNWLSSYYLLGVFTLSVLCGGILFSLSWLRSGENGISPQVMSCFEIKDPRKCSRRNLQKKRLKNKEIEEVSFTRCFCKNLFLSQVTIYNSDFRDNNFNQSFFYKVSFFDTNLFKAFFYGSVLKEVVFKDSDLGGAIFNFSTLENVSFKNIDLSSSLFIGALFKNVSYDKNTILPFSEETARQKGWVLQE